MKKRTLVEHDSLKVDEEVLRRQVEVLNQVTETPQFHALIDELRAAKPEDRRALARKIQWVPRLEEGGVEVPQSMRMTERSFEDPTSGNVAEIGDFTASKTCIQPQMGACVSVGEIICVSYG